MDKCNQYQTKQQYVKQIIASYYEEKHKSTISKDEITVSPLFSLTNDVYSVKTQQQSLLLKIYQPNLEEFTDNLLERLIVCKLAERGLYPLVLYYNPQLRIQEFIDSALIEQGTLSKHKLISIINKLADFSCHFGDFVKQYNSENNIRSKYDLGNLLEIFKNIYTVKKQQCPQLIAQSKQDLQSIFHNKQIIDQLGQILQSTPLILCHNDCHLGNVLFSSKGEFIVDYQFSQLNFIGYDIGNFLNEWATEYSSIFQIRQTHQMEEALMNQIITIYFNKIDWVYHCGSNFSDWLYYTKIGRVVSHFFWMIIGLKQINHAKICFSMVYYIKRRKEQFLKHFNQLLSMKK